MRLLQKIPGFRFKVRRLKRRPGVNMVETIAAVILMSLLMLAVSRLSLLELEELDAIDTQYSVLSVDAFMADIYTDFHAAQSYELVDSAGGQRMLIFMMPDGSTTMYSYSSAEQACYINGIYQFEATRFEVVGTTASMTVSVKLPTERLITYTIYR